MLEIEKKESTKLKLFRNYLSRSAKALRTIRAGRVRAGRVRAVKEMFTRKLNQELEISGNTGIITK